MIKILIVDDHPIVQEGFRQILIGMPEIQCVETANSGIEAIKKARSGHYDVIVLDISLPDKNGLDVLNIMKSEMPEIPVLILSIYSEEIYGIRTLKAGASGYITKDSNPKEFITAIKTLLSGRKYISPSMGEKLVTELREEQLPHERLSDQEYKIFQFIAEGKTLGEIADILGLSVKTVYTYKSRLLKKMNLHTDSELTYYAIKNGLIN